MGKVKSNLPDDYVFEPTVEPDYMTEPSITDVYINDLMRICNEFSVNIPFGYDNELREAINALQSVLERVVKPF